MKFPILICQRNTLVVGSEGYFDGIGSVDEDSAGLEINVTSSSRGDLNWILDARGELFVLEPLRITRGGLLELVGLRRRRAIYRIKAHEATAGEILALVSGLEDEMLEVPNVADLREFLAPLDPKQVLTRELLLSYFGQ